MEIVFSSKAQEDILFWKRSGNTGVQKKITALLKDIADHPFSGIGKPEELKGNLSGLWSRRITKEDRLVYSIIYKVEEGVISVLSLRGHYKGL